MAFEICKKIEPSPKVEQVLLLCDNFLNELKELNNEVNERLEIVIKRQNDTDELQSYLIDIMNKLVKTVADLHGAQEEIKAIKAEQQRFSELSDKLEGFVKSKAEQFEKDNKKNEENLKKHLPGVE